MTMSETIIFFGNQRLASGVTTDASILLGLITAGYTVAAVVIAQNDSSASRKNRELEIATVATDHGIPILSPVKLSDAQEELEAFHARAAVLAAYGKIVPQKIIDIFPRGIINVHPSLLPRHRGSTPIESVILDGSLQTGVSLMALTAALDAGPLYAQQSLDLQGTETKQDLTDKLTHIGRNMVLEHLPSILDGSLKPVSQNDSQATYDSRILKSDGQLDFQKTALQLEREVRAYYSWPRTRTTIFGIDTIVTSCHMAKASGKAGELWLEDKQLGIFTSQNALIVDTLIPAGKKEMSASSFLDGYGH
jgi:methionyl-tRNA formyltransferase